MPQRKNKDIYWAIGRLQISGVACARSGAIQGTLAPKCMCATLWGDKFGGKLSRPLLLPGVEYCSWKGVGNSTTPQTNGGPSKQGNIHKRQSFRPYSKAACGPTAREIDTTPPPTTSPQRFGLQSFHTMCELGGSPQGVSNWKITGRLRISPTAMGQFANPGFGFGRLLKEKLEIIHVDKPNLPSSICFKAAHMYFHTTVRS